MANSRSLLYRAVALTFVFSVVVGATLATQRRADATANFSRKYNIPCKACHSPSVPRLNRKGHTFRKLGFRMPEEVGQKPEYKELGEYLSLRLRPRYTYNKPKTGSVDSEFKVNDATLFYNGPVTKDLSINTEIEYDNLSEIRVFGAMMWFQGDAQKNWRFRLGQMHTIPRVGFGVFDRPTGINTTDIIGRRITNSMVPFSLSVTRQRGFEAAYSHDEDGRIIFMIVNGMDPGGAADKSDVDNDKDIILAYERILDEQGSSVTLYYYKGTWHRQRTVGGVLQPLDDPQDEFKFNRFAITANYIFPPKDEKGKPWEILAGYVRGEDEYPSLLGGPTNTPGEKVKGSAGMVEIQKWLPHDAAAFVRYDKIGKGVDTKRISVGYVRNVNDNLRLGVEYNRATSSVAANAGKGLIVEAMFNF